MGMWRRPAAVAGLLLVLGAPQTGWAQKFMPFTPVTSVCPTCTTGPQYDRIVLVGGSELRARVVAENDRFFVLEKFGELRAAGRDQVQTIEKNPSVERPTTYGDQILFRDGIVVAGAPTRAQAHPGPLALTRSPPPRGPHAPPPRTPAL